MSRIGYYRYKTTASETKTVTLYKNGVDSGSKIIEPIQYCTGDRIVKYLDSKGQYRYYAFNKYYEINDRPKQVGTTNQFISSILTESNSKNIGYANKRSISLIADVDSSDLVYLSDIYVSPRIYLYVGSNNSDTASDWVEVTRKGGDSVVRRRGGNTGRFELEIELPEHFSIKMI